MEPTNAVEALARLTREMFTARPELQVQMVTTARVTIAGGKTTGARALGIYHLDDGEAGYNTADVKPIATALRKALKVLTVAGKACNAVLLAMRKDDSVSVRLIMVEAGDVRQGQYKTFGSQTDAEMMRGDKDVMYRVAQPVGRLIEIGADGGFTIETKPPQTDTWDFDPVPWGDRIVDLPIRQQVNQAVLMEYPSLPTIRRIGLPQPN